jgi:hypothetical protein
MICLQANSVSNPGKSIGAILVHSFVTCRIIWSRTDHPHPMFRKHCDDCRADSAAAAPLRCTQSIIPVSLSQTLLQRPPGRFHALVRFDRPSCRSWGLTSLVCSGAFRRYLRCSGTKFILKKNCEDNNREALPTCHAIPANR